MDFSLVIDSFSEGILVLNQDKSMFYANKKGSDLLNIKS